MKLKHVNLILICMFFIIMSIHIFRFVIGYVEYERVSDNRWFESHSLDNDYSIFAVPDGVLYPPSTKIYLGVHDIRDRYFWNFYMPTDYLFLKSEHYDVEWHEDENYVKLSIKENDKRTNIVRVFWVSD